MYTCKQFNVKSLSGTDIRIKEFSNQFSQEDLDLLLSKMSIYRGNYNKETVDRDKTRKWTHINKYLDDYTLLCAINKPRNEYPDIAVNAPYMINFFVLDIDFHPKYLDHDTLLIDNQCYDLPNVIKNHLITGKTEEEKRKKAYYAIKEDFLRKKYNQVVEAFNGDSSLLNSTRRGIHLYFFLNEKVNTDILHEWITSKLRDNNLTSCIDVKPGIDSCIRIFSKLHLLYPDFMPYRRTTKFSTILKRARTYSLSELFSEQIANSLSAERKGKFLTNKEDYEKYPVIGNGETNDALNALIPLWKSRGLTDSECETKFINRLSANYCGDVKDNLAKRISCYTHTSFSSKIDQDKIYNQHKPSIDKAIEISNSHYKNSHNAKLRADSIKKLMVAIFNAQDRADRLYDNTRSFYRSCSLNPYLYHNYKDLHAIPLSSIYLKNCVTNYTSILKFLKSIGFITKETTYSIYKNSCIHYSIKEFYYKTTISNLNHNIYKHYYFNNKTFHINSKSYYLNLKPLKRIIINRIKIKSESLWAVYISSKLFMGLHTRERSMRTGFT